jgi:hypothetical protein
MFFFQWPQNVQVGYGSINNWPPASESGSVLQDYGSADPDPKEIVTDLQHRAFTVPKKRNKTVLFRYGTVGTGTRDVISELKSKYSNWSTVQVKVDKYRQT